MARKYFIPILIMALALLISSGCKKGETISSEEPLSGKDVPEYKALLDPAVTAQFLRDQMEDASEEERKILEKANESTGALDWQLVNIEAKEDNGTIGVRTTAKFGGESDSFHGFLDKVEPVKANIIKGFTRDNLLGIFASGNVKGWSEACTKWLFDTKAIDNMIKASGGGIEEIVTWGSSKLFLVSLNETMKEEMYPYLGDELALAIYTNDDFIGFDNFDDADTFMDVTPVRVITAVSVGKKGLASSFGDILEKMLSSGPMATMTALLGGLPDIQKKKGDGYDIYYFEMGSFFSAAWAEYDGTLFISDLDTIENIAMYYDPAKPVAAGPPVYNSYLYANIDNCIEYLVEPFEEDIREGWEKEKKNIHDDGVAGLVDSILDALENDEKFGTVEKWSHNSEVGKTTTLKVNSALGPFLLDFHNQRMVISDLIEQYAEEASQNMMENMMKMAKEGPPGF